MFLLAALVVGVAFAAPGRGTSPPRERAQPSLEGEFRVGETITTSNGQWRNDPTSFTYQWMRCNAQARACAEISGATKKSYELKAEDIGHRLTARVTARNDDGNTTANSQFSPVISSDDAPRNTGRPRISGQAKVGQTLTIDQGAWSGGVTFYSYQWLRCDEHGDDCEKAAGATSQTYGVRTSDNGKTLRVEVTAKNASGATTVSTDRTQVVQGPQSAPPPPATGCQPGARVDASALRLPARMLVDRWEFSPGVVTPGTSLIVTRIHISDTCGRLVANANVWATAIPYNQISTEVGRTGSDGWATVSFRVLGGFPANPGRQELLAILIRATSPGGSVLAGTSTRRVVSLRVAL